MERSATYSDPVVALRHGNRFIERLERYDIGERPGLRRFRQKGVYLITGGLGDLGLVIALELARQFQARVALLGRTALPPAREWQTALKSDGTPARVKERIRKLLEIESLGGEVLGTPCDVCRPDHLKSSIDAALATFGSINGVIHAAGVIEDGPLLLKSRESALRVLDPKVRGTLVLADVLDECVDEIKSDSPLDFIALFSSVSSVQAPAGQVDYVASNASLMRSRRVGSTRTLLLSIGGRGATWNGGAIVGGSSALGTQSRIYQRRDRVLSLVELRRGTGVRGPPLEGRQGGISWNGLPRDGGCRLDAWLIRTPC